MCVEPKHSFFNKLVQFTDFTTIIISISNAKLKKLILLDLLKDDLKVAWNDLYGTIMTVISLELHLLLPLCLLHLVPC